MISGVAIGCLDERNPKVVNAEVPPENLRWQCEGVARDVFAGRVLNDV